MTERPPACAGGCHCGNIRVRLQLSNKPEQVAVRTCTCSFCRAHSTRMVSDPAGLLEVSADDWSIVQRYRFGTRTCDFLICGRCGVFVAAISDPVDGQIRSVVNVNCLDERMRFPTEPAVHSFEDESVETRLVRRTANWMPAIIHGG